MDRTYNLVHQARTASQQKVIKLIHIFCNFTSLSLFVGIIVAEWSEWSSYIIINRLCYQYYWENYHEIAFF